MGYENPRIVFPSGEDFELWDAQLFLVDVARIDLPYFHTCEAAFKKAEAFIVTGLSPISYVEKLDESNLLLYCEPNSEGCIITYDNDYQNGTGRMTNIQSFVVEVEAEQ
jgi:hypothetical protein